MSGGDSSFESVEGELVCDNEQLNGGRKGGFKLLDIDAIRCAKESKDDKEAIDRDIIVLECTVNPSKGSGRCMPSTDCKDVRSLTIDNIKHSHSGHC